MIKFKNSEFIVTGQLQEFKLISLNLIILDLINIHLLPMQPTSLVVKGVESAKPVVKSVYSSTIV